METPEKTKQTSGSIHCKHTYKVAQCPLHLFIVATVLWNILFIHLETKLIIKIYLCLKRLKAES